jgi:TonB family protein
MRVPLRFYGSHRKLVHFRNISAVWKIFLTLPLVHTMDCQASAVETSDEVTVEAAIYAPKPEYPYQARVHRQTGSGVAVVTVDSPTGKVTTAEMAQSTGARVLDEAAVEAFRQWKFKPGTLTKGKIPISFVMGNSGSGEIRIVKRRPMDEVLAPFLGKGNVITAPIPQYPPYWATGKREGKGIYELHVDKFGKVGEVRILKSSGDANFDHAALATLRTWRLRKGPLVIELPLAFVMTPESFRVRIP